ncbi:MAG: hypothetical protein RL404_2315, partial [Pseudomonadota bacterium]
MVQLNIFPPAADNYEGREMKGNLAGSHHCDLTLQEAVLPFSRRSIYLNCVAHRTSRACFYFRRDRRAEYDAPSSIGDSQAHRHLKALAYVPICLSVGCLV